MMLEFLRDHVSAFGTFIPNRQADVLCLARKRSDREPHGVGAVAIDKIHRVDTIPL